MSAYIAFCLTFIPMLYIIGHLKKKYGYIFLLIAGVMCLDIIVYYTTHISVLGYSWERIHINLNDLKNVSDFSIHYFGPIRYIRGYYESFLLFKSHPFLGIGLNNTHLYVDPFFARLSPPPDLLASTGLIGFIAFYFFMFLLWGRILKLKRALDLISKHRFYISIAWMFVTSAFIKAFFSSNYQYCSSWFWFDLSFAALIFSNLKATVKT